MKKLCVLLILLAPLAAYASEKDTIIGDIRIICQEDDPATEYMRRDGVDRLLIMRSAIARSSEFTKGDRNLYRNRIDTCVMKSLSAMTAKAETRTEPLSSSSTTSGARHSVAGQAVSARCDMRPISLAADEWSEVKNNPDKYSRFISDFNRLVASGCFVSPSP